MENNEVSAFDAIKKYAQMKGVSDHKARNELLQLGFLERRRSLDKPDSFNVEVYDLSKVGREILESGKSFHEYLKDKEYQKFEKEKREDYKNELQIQELETKLNTLNNAQLDFWKAQKEKNLQTTLIAIISALFSFVALLKSWGYF